MKLIANQTVNLAHIALAIFGLSLFSRLATSSTDPGERSQSQTLNATDARPSPVWVSVAEEDLRRNFAAYTNCKEKANLAILRISAKLVDGNPRAKVVEKWSISGCGRELAWMVTFNPDSTTGLSYKLWTSELPQEKGNQP